MLAPCSTSKARCSDGCLLENVFGVLVAKVWRQACRLPLEETPNAQVRVHRKRLVSWNRPFVIEEGRVRDPVKRLVLIKYRDRSVSLIRTLPLAVKETRTVTGATKPAAQGQCRLGQLALQAGVI